MFSIFDLESCYTVVPKNNLQWLAIVLRREYSQLKPPSTVKLDFKYLHKMFRLFLFFGILKIRGYLLT